MTSALEELEKHPMQDISSTGNVQRLQMNILHSEISVNTVQDALHIL